MMKKLPVGSGVFYEESEGIYHPKYMNGNSGGNASKISLHWLNFKQNLYVDDGNLCLIQCAANGPEKQIGPYFLDGFVIFKEKRIGLDFRGCRFHPCDKCPTLFIGNQVAAIRDRDRFLYLEKELDEYITVSECEYKKQMTTNKGLLNFFWGKKNISAADIIDAIKNGNIYGLAKVNIITPENAQKKVRAIIQIVYFEYLRILQTIFLYFSSLN